MRVVATGKGYDGLNIREDGDIFEMPDGATGSWFEPLDEGDAPKPAAKKVKEKPVGKPVENKTLAGADDLA